MAYQFACRDVGAECSGVFKAEQPDALVKQVATHLTDQHKLQRIPQSLVNLALTVVREVPS